MDNWARDLVLEVKDQKICFHQTRKSINLTITRQFKKEEHNFATSTTSSFAYEPMI